MTFQIMQMWGEYLSGHKLKRIVPSLYLFTHRDVPKRTGLMMGLKVIERKKGREGGRKRERERDGVRERKKERGREREREKERERWRRGERGREKKNSFTV